MWCRPAGRVTLFAGVGKPVLLTDGLARQVEGKVDTHAKNVRVLQVKGDPKSLLQLSGPELDDLRAAILAPLKISFHAPARVALYSFADGTAVVENFNDEPATVELNGKPLTIAARDWARKSAP